MVESVAYEYVQVAHKLGVEPELLLNLHRTGHLPAIKAGRRANILIADRDLVTVLRRCLMVRAAEQLKVSQAVEAVTPEVEHLNEAILAYLEKRYGVGLLLETVRQVVDKLSPKGDRWRNLEKMVVEIISRTLPRRLSRLNRSEAMREIPHFANAA